MAVLMLDPDLQVAGGAIRNQLVHQEGQVEEDHHNPRYGGAAMSFSGSQPAGRDFVGGSRFGQPSSDTYGGMNGGQMVMGSAMGAGGAQFGGGGFGGVGDFVGPGGGFQPAGGGFGSQTTGGGFGGGGPSPILDPSRPLLSCSAKTKLLCLLLCPRQVVLSTCACSRVCVGAFFTQVDRVWICLKYPVFHELEDTNHTSTTPKPDT